MTESKSLGMKTGAESRWSVMRCPCWSAPVVRATRVYHRSPGYPSGFRAFLYAVRMVWAFRRPR